VGDAEDCASTTLRDEIEILRGQIEHLTADVRANSHPDTPFM
jgi:hypothetical protein